MFSPGALEHLDAQNAISKSQIWAPCTLHKQMTAFHGGPVVKNPASLARGVGLIPGRRTEISHDADK